ncbi:MAG: type I-F CRISPR-associated endoribonuclease Cas6/Csy4 [Opitutaceae bacterium]|nr:type I-F CRISPR-associated endoribonuclease Cas6/Csy4 [Opitutaceae bacterium]
MMKYYLDITLLPDAEANLGFLWQKVYQQVHLALVENRIAENRSEIAVSFPKYGDKTFPLGDKLRLLAEEKNQLEQLKVGEWLNRLTDYAHITSIKTVPSEVSEYAYFKRKQFDTNIERLARRRVKRKGETFEQAMKHLKGFKGKESGLPFINIKSLSGSHSFRLFFEQKIVDISEAGDFNCYGLSHEKKQATVPWFE